MASVNLSEASKNVRAQALIDLAGSLVDAPVLKLYADPQPASPDDAPDPAALLLATFTCPQPFAPDAVGGVILSNPFESLMANGDTGVAAWARLELSDGTAIGDFTVGLESTGANIEMANTNIYPGVILQVNTFRLIEA